MVFPLLLSLWLAASPAEDPELCLIPWPKALTRGEGSLTLTPASRIRAEDRELEPLARILAAEIRALTGVELATETRTSADAPATPSAATDIVLALDPGLSGEAYTLAVPDSVIATGTGGCITIRAGSYASVASGTVTLLQALRLENGVLSVPRMHIVDEPAHAYRGALLDLARKYHTPGGIEQVIELCRLYKVRYLQLHLTDDQLFLFPSTRFPGLGRSNQEFARFEPGSKARIEPYTRKELEALELHARERGVVLVPEIDLPGHSGRLIADAPDVFGLAGQGSTVNIASATTRAALATLLNELMDVFQSTPYVHLGADEVDLSGLEESAEFKQAQAELGLRSVHELYARCIRELHDVVAKRGKQSIVWEEAWNPEGPCPLPSDVVVMCWTHGRNPADIVRSGHAVINASWTPLYIVRGDKRPLEFLFRWQVPMFGRGHLGDDTFTTLSASERILGAQLCSWENSESIEIQSLRERLALVGEKTWNPAAGGTLAEFRRRLAHTDALLDLLVHPVAIEVQGNFAQDENTFTEPLTVTLVPRRAGHTLRYTLDNRLPDESWRVYRGPLTIRETVHLRAGLFDERGELQGHLVGAWFRSRIPLAPNLATGRPVRVGPGPDRSDEWSARVAVDGRADEADAHWASTDPAPQWLQVDLEQVQHVDSVNVITYWDGGRSYRFTVELSVDGQDWTRALDFSANTAVATSAGYSGTFPATPARYVRVHMLANSANPFVHIVELIVDGTK